MMTKMNQAKTMLMSILSAAILLLGLSACSAGEFDNPVSNNPLGSQVVGMWYNVAYTEGNLPDDWSHEGNAHYTRVLHVLQLDENGNGYACAMWFDNEDNIPVYSTQGPIPMTYTTKPDGRIILNFDEKYTEKEFADHFRKLTLKYTDGIISCHDGTTAFQMEMAGSAMSGWILDMIDKFIGGDGDDEIDYNINDYTIDYAGKQRIPITADNWRQRGSIFIYVGGTGSASIKDTHGETGYEIVNMPWSDLVDTNLPVGFCDDITPENGWEWAYNLCGNRAIRNGNFFALYNKYTGILRFFYYMPDLFEAGPDHAWEVSLTDDIAMRSLWGYGLPTTQTFKDKSKNTFCRGNFWSDYVTPYVKTMGMDGAINASPGWWAFDVDMSVYRPDAIALENNSISLQMRSWATQSLNLWSTMTATIEGEIKQKVEQSKGWSSVSWAKGAILGLQGAALLGSGYFGYKATGSDGLYKMLGSVAGMLGCGGAFAGLFGGAPKPFEASVSLGMNGTIDSQGTISSSEITTGVTSPTINLSKFFSQNAPTFGQGVWNIKKNPVVYVVDDMTIDWRRQDMDTDKNFNNIAYPEKMPSPFGGQANIYPNNDSWDWAKKPFQGMLCLFDPSSIEVELNPNVFPEGATYKVSAVCGVRKGMKYGSTDSYRSSMGLQSSMNTYNNLDRVNNHISNRSWREAPFDGLYGYEAKQTEGYITSTMFDVEEYYLCNNGAFGCGNSSYLIEPMSLTGVMYISGTSWNMCNLAPYEVTVILTVSSDGKDYVYCRTYLPEYEHISFNQVADVCKQANDADRTHFTELYDSQVARMQAVNHWMGTTPICDNSIQTRYQLGGGMAFDWTSESVTGYSLIDGNPSTLWGVKEGSRNYFKYSYYDSKTGFPTAAHYSNVSKAGDWTCAWMEFHTLLSNEPKSFTVMCSKRTDLIPRDLRLFAKNRADGEWVEIYKEENFNQRLKPQEGATVVCNIPANKQGQYKYYRVECSGSQGDYALAELTLNYE